MTIALMMWSAVPLVSQGEGTNNMDSGSLAQREEVQRYFGYEDLLYRYFTLPYDVSANVNQQGKFVDIGFALFALIPLGLLYFNYSRKRWFYATMVFCVIYILICFRFSFLLDVRNGRYNPSNDGEMITAEMARNDGVLLHPVYQLSAIVAQPIQQLLDKITGQRDHVTYPLVALTFLAMIFFASYSKRLSRSTQVLGVLTICYAFLWWILSSGIIWYGFLMIPLGYALIGKFISWRPKGTPKVIAVFFTMLSLLVIGLWMFLSYTSRISNVGINVGQDHPNYGAQIVEPRIMPYSVGNMGVKESLNELARNFPLAIDRINSDSKLVLQFGSSFAFEIKNNQNRLFDDNNIAYFHSWAQLYKTRANITQALKDFGFGYIILDLRLPSLDRTPERSLRQKYNILLNGYLKDNDDVRLLATDQIVTIDGNVYMGVFGEGRPKVFGSYAVFELL